MNHSRPWSSCCGKLAGVLLLYLVGAHNAPAQLKGHNITGDFGLQAGSQPPPGIYVINLGWIYRTDTLKNDDGNQIKTNTALSSGIEGPALGWTTNLSLLGAHLGGTAAFPFMKNRIQANSLDVSTPMKYSDTYIQPFSLGWHFKQVDIVAGYGIFLPTGHFEAGGSENSGLGMYSHEISAGSTVFFNKEKTWHAAALMAYEMHTQKKDLDETVGDLVTIEGGAGKTFYKKVNNPLPLIANIGVAGYTQFKATSDSGDDLPIALRGHKDRVFAIGPEVNVFVPQIKLTLGLRFLPEFGGRLRTQGQTWVISLAYILKPLTRTP